MVTELLVVDNLEFEMSFVNKLSVVDFFIIKWI